jgi:hypothetical protein
LSAPEEDLRAVQQSIEAAAVAETAATLRGRRLALLAAHLDPLVDSVDTVAHVLVESADAAVPA